MMDLRELYQEMILDHNRAPRHYHAMIDPNRQACGHNPLCGDELTLFLKVQAGRITDVSFQGSGCAISTASASMMTDALIGKTEQEAKSLFESIHAVLTGQSEATGALGKLTALAGVCAFPARVKCATLAWHTMVAALNQEQDAVSTE